MTIKNLMHMMNVSADVEIIVLNNTGDTEIWSGAYEDSRPVIYNRKVESFTVVNTEVRMYRLLVIKCKIYVK